MKKCLFFLSFLCFLVLGGCQQAARQPVSHVVTAVQITSHQEDAQIFRYYTSEEKMRCILLYLRLLQPTGALQADANAVDADVYNITLCLSDGSQRVYRQKDHRYLSVDGHPWQAIDPGQAAGLYHLMRTIPDDRL